MQRVVPEHVLAASGAAGAARVAVVPLAVLAVLLLGASIVVPARGKRPFVALGGLTLLVAVGAYIFYLPYSA